MILSELYVENFRSLKAAKFEFKPITLLIGPNNSGKSSLIHLLLTLKQTLESRNLDAPFVLDGNYVELGTYSDVVFSHETKKQIRISLNFTKPERQRVPLFRFFVTPFTVDFSIGYDLETQTTYLHSLQVTTFPNNINLIRYSDGHLLELFGKETRKPLPITDEIMSQRGLTANARKRHFMLQVVAYRILSKIGPRVRTHEMSLRYIPTFLEDYFREKIFYIGPLREYPKRYYLSSGEKPHDVGLRGERTVDLLYLGDIGLTDRISKWLQLFEIARQIEVDRVADGIWRILVLDDKTQLKVNMKDVGFGTSQLLPLIVQGFNSPPDSMIIIEQPEIHLHPKAQATLADFLIDIAKLRKTLLVETHSEHLLLRLSRRIAEGKLNNDDVVIYGFEKTSEGTSVTKVSFDKKGNIKKWPADFFETELEETLAHIKAISKQNGDIGNERDAGN